MMGTCMGRALCILAITSAACGKDKAGAPSKNETPAPRSAPATSDKSPAQTPAAKAAPVTVQVFREAALGGQLEVVRAGLSQGVDLAAADEQGRTAMHMAAFDGRSEILQELLKHKPAIDGRDKGGRTALMYAASGANLSTVKLLLASGADANLVDTDENFSALMFAASEGQLAVVQALLAHGVDADLRDVDGDTALNFAVEKKHPEVVKLLTPTGATN